jgi:mono/diheme cytochrome c family protein
VAFLVLILVACAERPAATAIPPSTAQVSKGEQLYVANCQVCHGGATGGSMMDLPPPHNANGHTWHHSDRQLTDIVLNGSGEMGEMMRRMMGASADTPRMPAWRGTLTEKDVAAILAYIKTWWTPEQREWQARVSEVSR